jgi:SAM-dependent methyltransferase
VIAFTISSRNFYGYTQTLHDSFRRFHPDVPFYAVLADAATDFDVDGFPFRILLPEDLGVPDFEAMTERYNITELNTALKPFAFLCLFDLHPGETVLYLDPDILVVSRFAELLDLVKDGAECVLTPHLTEPAEYEEFGDHQALRYGINNLGFCTLRDTPEVRRAVWWWARQLEFHCTIDLENGLFVDQKWADLLPAFIERSILLRHPGYNVGYWNLAQRRVSRAEDVWLVNGRPLRFVHFSGNKIEDEAVFSRHSTQFEVHNIGALRALLDDYRARVIARGHGYFKAIPYAFGWLGTSGVNSHTPPAVAASHREPDSAVPYLPLMRWSRRDDYESWRAVSQSIAARRLAAETDDISTAPVFTLPGFCAVCEAPSEFRVSAMYSQGSLPDGRAVPNWREHLDCLGCRLVTRLRGAYQILRQEIRPTSASLIYVTEQVTPLFARLKQSFPYAVGSEYLGPSYQNGATVDGVRHEDVQALSFPDGAFDYILSFDVLGHVSDERQALREFFRTLRPGGSLLFTVPFSVDRYECEVRAVMDADGGITHRMEPEYHGNPVHAAGSLSSRTFGWRLLDDLRRVGFAQAEVVTYWSRRLRYYGDPQVAVIARKTPQATAAQHGLAPALILKHPQPRSVTDVRR